MCAKMPARKKEEAMRVFCFKVLLLQLLSASWGKPSQLTICLVILSQYYTTTLFCSFWWLNKRRHAVFTKSFSQRRKIQQVQLIVTVFFVSSFSSSFIEKSSWLNNFHCFGVHTRMNFWPLLNICIGSFHSNAVFSAGQVVVEKEKNGANLTITQLLAPFMKSFAKSDFTFSSQLPFFTFFFFWGHAGNYDADKRKGRREEDTKPSFWVAKKERNRQKTGAVLCTWSRLKTED